MWGSDPHIESPHRPRRRWPASLYSHLVHIPLFQSSLFRGLAILSFAAVVILALFTRSVIRGFSSPLADIEASLNVNTSGLRDSRDPLVSLAVGAPVILGSDPSLGSADAKVTIVAFEDFECPFCALVSPRLVKVAREFPNDVRLVWKDFPITEQHENAVAAAEAARCADTQGKFWEYHDKLFEDVFTLNPARYAGIAKELGLDETKFAACVDSRAAAKLVNDSRNHALDIGLDGTPFVFLNGKEFSDVVTYESIKAAVQAELSK